jgi:hypothetical protein
MKKRNFSLIQNLTVPALLSALLLVFTGCGEVEVTVNDGSGVTEPGVAMTDAITESAAKTADDSSDSAADSSESSSDEADNNGIVGWWYRNEDLEGIPIISIFEVRADGTFAAYDTLKNVVLEGGTSLSGDLFTINIEGLGEVEFYFQNGALCDDEGNVHFSRGEELEAPDNSYVYGTWYENNDTSADSLTLSEDGTFEQYDSFYEMTVTGNYEVDVELMMISGMDIDEGDESILIRLGSEDDFFVDEYVIMPSGNTMYIEDTWGDVLVFAKEGLDESAYDYDRKMIALTQKEYSWSNDGYAMVFYKNGYFSIDQVEQTETSYSSSYYMSGSYTVNDDFTSVYVSFDDGSFAGDCPLDLDAGTLYVEPIGDLT